MRDEGAAADRRLDHSLVSGMAWTAALRWPAQVISWVATAYAARHLAPAHYGLVSMAMIAIGLVRMVEDFGLDAILVQDRTIVGERQARLAGFVLTAGVALCALFVALAHPVAAFFGEPQVMPIVALLSLLCVFDAIQVVPRAQLQREMKFAHLAWAQFLQIMVTQGTLVFGAYQGWGVWALVCNTLAGAMAVTLLLVLWCPYAVRWPGAFGDLARPLIQGWRVLASRIAYYAYSNADQVVIGRVLGKDSLGAYSFATTLSTTLSQEIASVVSRVVPGIFSAVQSSPTELRRYFLVLTELVAYLTLPISIGLALTADLAVRIVLGPQWDAVVLPLRILCVYAAMYTSQMLIVLAGIGLPLGFLVGTQWGLPGVAWAWSIVFPLVNLPAMVISFRTLRAGFGDWLLALAPAATACAGLAAALIAVRIALPDGTPVALETALAVGAGAIGYLLVLALLFTRRVLAMWRFLKALRSGRTPVPTGVLAAD
jgi:teichuronic acid exporter